MKRPAAALALVAAAALPLKAGPFDLSEEAPSGPSYRLQGLLDLRAAETSSAASWLLGGSNKLRYGGKSLSPAGATSDAAVLAVPQASLVFDGPVPHGPTVHLQLNADADTDSGVASAGLVEAYAEAGRRGEKGAASLKAGAFIPPVSWEHTDLAWSTHYTLTPSAIGSWVSEELRVYGAEASLQGRAGSQTARLSAAVFEGGDQAGWLLLARGWSLHDYQAKLGDRFTLPSGAVEQPARELDGRAGYYGRVDVGLADNLVKLSGGYFDNNGDPNAYLVQGGSSAPVWSTQFWDAGAKLDWRRLTVIAQVLNGRSAMPTVPRRGWDAWYVLAAYQWGDWMVSGRYDHFRVDAWEDGYALTGDLQLDLGLRSRLSLEYIYAYSYPNLAVRPSAERDEILQLNYRLKFGG